ncbi:MAG: hypothetical protein HC805_03245 [Alkalinema sp. RL_2_19]|nr:hypothetical protein [Alkalinema sp. RL_2_19]
MVTSDKPETNGHSLSGGNVKYEPQYPTPENGSGTENPGSGAKNPAPTPTTPEPPLVVHGTFIARPEIYWQHQQFGIGTHWYIDHGTQLAAAQSLV